MTRVFPVLLAVSLLGPVCAKGEDPVVGSGTVISETRKLAEFDEIELRIAGDLHVTIGEPTPLELKGDDNILPLIETEVRDGRLVISTERPLKAKQTLLLKVTVADLKAAEIRGSGDMHIRGVDNESLSLGISGSGDLHFDGKTERLIASVAGSGDAHLVGKARQLTVNIAGSGDVTAFGLEARTGSVSIAGSGDAKVSVAGSLSIMIAGSGDVHYAGDPKVSKVICGSGDIKKRRG